MLVFALVFLIVDLRDRFAVGLHDLKIVVVHPDASLEIPLLADDLLGSDVEYIAVQVVFLLLPHIKYVVLANFVAGQNERQPVANVIEIAWRLDPRTGRLIVMSAEDNILKGASGQAVQSMNIMCGFSETAGLI